MTNFMPVKYASKSEKNMLVLYKLNCVLVEVTMYGSSDSCIANESDRKWWRCSSRRMGWGKNGQLYLLFKNPVWELIFVSAMDPSQLLHIRKWGSSSHIRITFQYSFCCLKKYTLDALAGRVNWTVTVLCIISVTIE